MKVIPPQNIAAERALLGAFLLEPESIDRIPDLTSGDFYKFGDVYAAMLRVREKGAPVEFVALEAEGCNSPELAAMAADAVTAANVAYHAKIVKEAASLRKIQKACIKTLQSIGDADHDGSDALIAQLHSEMSAVIKNQGGMVTDMKDVARRTLAFIDRRYKDRGALSGIPSGFKDIDAVTDGFQQGDLIILAGRPGMGKSALAMAVAQNAASAGHTIAVISLEMGEQQLCIRALSSLSGIDLLKLRKGILNQPEFDDIVKAAGRLASLPVYFSFSTWDLDQIRKVITQMVQTHGAKIAIVDYLQLAKNPGQKSREREIGEISTTLKQLAKTFQIPIIALSQLSRAVETREDKRPKLSDLRDSGQIEQDADVVMFLYRENPAESKGSVEVIFAKGRNLGLGRVRLFFDGDRMTFRDIVKGR